MTKMNIRDAIVKAEFSNAKGISRKSDPSFYIHGTNTPDCCLFCTKKERIPRWEPNYDDLAAKDWFVVNYIGYFKKEIRCYG